MGYTLAYTGAEIDALLGKIDAIFVAEYGSTIYSEVTAAIAAGNKVIVANAGKVFVYAGTDDNSGYVFTQAGPNAQSPSVTYATLSTGDVWSTATGALPSITYVDTAVATEQARAEGVEAKKADSDGIYPDLTAGTALQLLGNTYTEDKTPYNFRKSGGSVKVGTREKDKIVGGTVAFTQLVRNGNFADTTGWNVNGGTTSFASAGNVGTITANSISGGLFQGVDIPLGHKCLFTADIKNTKACEIGANQLGNRIVINSANANFVNYAMVGSVTSATVVYVIYSKVAEENIINAKNVCIFDLTQMFGSTIADYIYSLEQGNAGAGVAYFRNLFPKPYYDYNAGELMSVKTSAHNMVGFNAWDEEWRIGNINTETGELVSGVYLGSVSPISILPDTTYYFKRGNYIMWLYFYDAEGNYITGLTPNNYKELGRGVTTYTTPSNARYMHFLVETLYGNTYNHDICINLSWDGSRNGEYEPYELHSYPLDADLELRGIPKLDANNALYYDGDIYEPSKKVTRRYALSHLGDWAWNTNGTVFYAYPPSTLKLGSPSGAEANILCVKYVNTDYVTGTSTDKTIYSASSTGMVYIHDSAYSDAATFKAALNGVYLLYEVKAPTTEEADPFAEIQIVSPYGTEEYVDERAVAIPVGHDTQYPTDLVAKIEEIPDPPTADGTYTLKASVSGGSVTYSWEA